MPGIISGSSKNSFISSQEDSTPPAEPYQEVYFDSTGLSSLTGKSGEEFTLPLKYRASDGGATGGLKLDLYYDSSVLTVEGVSDQLSASLISNNTFGTDLSDTSNEDSDESTDKKIEFN